MPCWGGRCFGLHIVSEFDENNIEARLIYLYFPPYCCINNERPTGQKQQLLDGRTVENKDKLILTEIISSVQKHGI